MKGLLPRPACDLRLRSVDIKILLSQGGSMLALHVFIISSLVAQFVEHEVFRFIVFVGQRTELSDANKTRLLQHFWDVFGIMPLVPVLFDSNGNADADHVHHSSTHLSPASIRMCRLYPQ